MNIFRQKIYHDMIQYNYHKPSHITFRKGTRRINLFFSCHGTTTGTLRNLTFKNVEETAYRNFWTTAHCFLVSFFLWRFFWVWKVSGKKAFLAGKGLWRREGGSLAITTCYKKTRHEVLNCMDVCSQIHLIRHTIWFICLYLKKNSLATNCFFCLKFSHLFYYFKVFL